MRIGFAIAAFATIAAFGAETAVDRAARQYSRTDYWGAIQTLDAANPKTAAMWDLLGRSHYMAGDFKKSSDCLEKAVALEPNNSNYRWWLGRAWGRRAETSSWFTALQYARKTRDNFEKSVALDGNNIEAINDLFEYYLEAPGFLGGGLDRAAKLAERIERLDPVEYHYALAKIAEKRKQFSTAEDQLRRASEMAPKQVGRVLDLAKFLSKQGRYQESDATFAKAHRIAPDSPKVLFEEAKSYVVAKRNLPRAQELLKQYLKAPLTPEDPPREEAEELLRKAAGG